MKPQAREKPLPIEVSLAINDGKILEAIKLLREAEGLDLMGAKAQIDRYLQANPAVREKVEEARKEARRSLVKKVLLFDAVIVIALIWWFFLR
jgi:ribosomal protein L7/L12